MSDVATARTTHDVRNVDPLQIPCLLSLLAVESELEFSNEAVQLLDGKASPRDFSIFDGCVFSEPSNTGTFQWMCSEPQLSIYLA